MKNVLAPAPRSPLTTTLRLLGGLLGGLSLSVGCGGVTPEDEAAGGLSRHAISGGYADDTSHAVVGVASFDQGFGLCSGSLIAPNLVLTARHCVADVENEVGGGVSCRRTTFGPARRASTFYVTTRPEFTQSGRDYRSVIEVVIPPVDDSFCGNDQAMLILGSNVPESEAKPLVPRIDDPLVAGEEYSAVGYGATNDRGNGSGERRRRDDLFTSCVGDECDPSYVHATEWTGDEGVCQGDSGGPAIDLDGRVIGVASRGGADCSSPVYGYVLGYADWIKETALRAAKEGGYAPPKWATGWPTDPAFDQPVGDVCADVAKATDCGDGKNGRCLADATQAEAAAYCTRQCSALAPCPEGYACDESGQSPALCVKLPPADLPGLDGGGCRVAPPGGRAADGALGLAMLLGLAFVGLARRRG